MNPYGATIVFEPRPVALRANHIYLGTTEPPRLVEVDGCPALVLNHKNATPLQKSTTQFICSRPESQIELWRATLNLTKNAADPLAGFTVVVEDASPDTCLSLAALVRRLRGEQLPKAWAEYAGRWESGDVRSTGIPECSFGALESALVHPYFDVEESQQPIQADKAVDEGIAYTEALLAIDADPANLPRDLPISLHVEASGRLELEWDRYRQVIHTGAVVQLLVPVRGTHRRRLLDAIVFSEIEPTGAVKTWLRSDPGSPSGRGYGMMALFRPRAAGTGNDMTISVDPLTQTHLHDLWCELEAREEAAWRSADLKRPRARPRRLNVYENHSDCEAIPCDQPWYDGEDLTLVAAPKALDIQGTPGSRLNWPDVLAALWTVYRPDSNVLASSRTCQAAQRLLLDAVAYEVRDCARDTTPLNIVDLVRPAGETDRAIWSASLERALAGSLSGSVPAIDRLPPREDFDVFHERGGTVLVSPLGIVLYEGREGIGFPATELLAASIEHSELLGVAMKLEERLEEATTRALRAVEVGDEPHIRRALTFIYRMQMDARKHFGAPPSVPADPLVGRVSGALRARWEAEPRFAAVVARVGELSGMVRSATEVRSAGLLRRLTIYGFPAVIFGAVAGDVVLPLSDDRASGVVFGVASFALAAYLLLVAVFTWLSHKLVRRTDQAWSKDLESTKVFSTKDPQLRK